MPSPNALPGVFPTRTCSWLVQLMAWLVLNLQLKLGVSAKRNTRPSGKDNLHVPQTLVRSIGDHRETEPPFSLALRDHKPWIPDFEIPVGHGTAPELVVERNFLRGRSVDACNDRGRVLRLPLIQNPFIRFQGQGDWRKVVVQDRNAETGGTARLETADARQGKTQLDVLFTFVSLVVVAL